VRIEEIVALDGTLIELITPDDDHEDVGNDEVLDSFAVAKKETK